MLSSDSFYIFCFKFHEFCEFFYHQLIVLLIASQADYLVTYLKNLYSFVASQKFCHFLHLSPSPSLLLAK